MQVQRRNEHILGVISYTHGLVRAEALEALAGVEQILHAGDVGAPEVLVALARIASVVAVRGNLGGSAAGAVALVAGHVRAL